MQEPKSRPSMQGQRRPSNASSTFFPHRPPPPPVPPIPSLPSQVAHSTSPPHFPYSQPYASYSRPRRHSLSTSSSSPTSPTFLPSPSSSISPIRQPLSSTSIRALRRRDITHPSSFEGAQVVGKRNSSLSAPKSPMGEEDVVDMLGTSAETAATSIFSEDLLTPSEISKATSTSPLARSQQPRLRSSTTSFETTSPASNDDIEPPFPIELDSAQPPPPYESLRARVKSGLFDRMQLFGQSQASTSSNSSPSLSAKVSEDELDARLAESVETAKRSTRVLNTASQPTNPPLLETSRSIEPISSTSAFSSTAPLTLKRSFTRLFSIRRNFDNAHHANPLPQPRSLSRFIEPLPTSILRIPTQKRKGRPRSISLPSPDSVKALKEEDPVDTILRTGGYDKTLFPCPPPRPLRPFSSLLHLPDESHSQSTSQMSDLPHAKSDLPDASTDEEETIELLDDDNQLNKRLSLSSQASSAAPYRSIFDMFDSDDPRQNLYEAPRAESCTIPDLPTFAAAHNRLASLDLARPDSPSSVYPPTIAISEYEDAASPLQNSFPSSRRRLLGPRPPSSLFAPSLLSSNRQSSASTALSGFGDFPFPPNFTVPTPPLPPSVINRLPYPSSSSLASTATVESPLSRAPTNSPGLSSTELSQFLSLKPTEAIRHSRAPNSSRRISYGPRAPTIQT